MRRVEPCSRGTKRFSSRFLVGQVVFGVAPRLWNAYVAVMKIAIASDHGGFALKADLIETLREWGHEVLDLGPDSDARVDYADFGYKITEAITSGKAERGVALCGSGIGISMAMNRHPDIRCALVTDPYCAALAREHNDANVIAMGGRIVGADMAKTCLQTFLVAEFQGGRHVGRVAKLTNPPQDS